MYHSWSSKGLLVRAFRYQGLRQTKRSFLVLSCSFGQQRMQRQPHLGWPSVAARTKVCQDDVLCNEADKETCSCSSHQMNTMQVKVYGNGVLFRDDSLVISETPVLHDACTSTIIDLLTHSSSGKKTTGPSLKNEYVVHESTLLRDTRHSVHRAQTDLQFYNGDMEYHEGSMRRATHPPTLVRALPPDALEWRPQKLQVKNILSYYAGLSKSRLTGLVVVTAMAGYAIAPDPLNPVVLLYCSIGTALTSSSANAVNQFFEVPFDSQMDRTKNRVLVKGLVTPLHAVMFAAATGAAGLVLLYTGVNELTALLGAFNLLLYTCVYTPLKRLSITNTWVGAVVGAIPPMMGWAGCTGTLGPGAWIIAALLFAWQFPHFNSLSWNLRPDYSRAGYRMMAVTNPGLCRRTALKYSASTFLLCTLAPVCNITTWTFAIDSFPFNLFLTYLAWKFYKDADSRSSRRLFRFSLIHLPCILVLMLISKRYQKQEEQDTSLDDGSHIPATVVR